MAAIPAGAGSLLGKRLGKYEVLALLALGGTAEIYLARIAGAAGFEKYVVVKCLHDHLADDQEFVKMFLDEARLAAHLDHSNIVQTFELGEYQNRYYMVMEFLAGLSLAMIVRRAGERLSDGRMPVALALNAVAQACAGLHYAHEKMSNGKPLNIVHRDISPQNLVVSFEGVVKVVDFGIAKAELRETRTRSGTIKGKFAYMSPEQCVANNVDRRTDVFALGVIAHELLTGRRLFKRPSPYETYQAVIECAVDPPSAVNHELDPGLDAIIMKAVAKEKEQRYPTAEAFGDALQSYLHHRGKGSGPNDIGRFIDEAFAQEIDEHGQRMRELIEGRTVGAGGWDEDEEPPKKGAGSRNSETAALRKPRAEAVAESAAAQSGLEDSSITPPQVDYEQGATDDGDMPADRTRIETNPLERLSASEISGISGVSTVPVPQQPPPPMPPITSAGPTMAARPNAPRTPAAMAAQPPPAGPPSRPKFPAAANLPTMIAEPDDDEDAPTNAPDLPGYIDPRGATGPSPALLQQQNGRASQPHAPVLPTASSQHPTMMSPMGQQQMQPMQPMQQMQQPMPMPMQQQMPMQPPMQPRPANVYDTGDHYPSANNMPMANPASVMSPVGEGYPPVDWAHAAAVPVRVVPAWMLALLFVAALGVALGITFAVAQIIK